jgi:hypothetical protein
MNISGATPLIAAVLLSGGTGGYATAANHVRAATLAPSLSVVTTTTASPNVNLTDYLGIPAITGAGVTILSLVLSVVLVWQYDRKRHKCYQGICDWLQRPILGSGAWTANDSWVTNISTGLVVVATILGATTATNTLFPGVALDRFAIVNIAAGFFVAAAPVVFGIWYSQFTAHNPGLTADAIVGLPLFRPAAIRVPSGASITMAADTTIHDGSGRWAIVRGGSTCQISPGAEIRVLAGIQLVAEACVRAAEQVVADVLAQAVAHASVEAAVQALADDDAPAVEQVVEQAIARAGAYAPAGRLAHEFEQMIESAVADAVHESIIWFSFVPEDITQADDIDQTIAGVFTVDEAGIQAAVRTGIQASRQAAAAGIAQTNVTGVQADIQALRSAIQQAVVRAVTEPDMLSGEQPAGAIMLAVTAAVGEEGVRAAAEMTVQGAADAPGRLVPQAIAARGRHAITRALAQAIPQFSLLPTQIMACSGSADIGALPGTTLQVAAAAGTPGSTMQVIAAAGRWTIQASDVLAQPPSPPVPPALPDPLLPGVQLVQLVPPSAATSDALLAQPVLIDAAGGAKVSVTGTARIFLRKGAVISAPQLPYYSLPKDRRLLAPQGTNVIVGNLGMILIANFFTMFGIGAELGIACVLAGFSDATGHGRGFIFLALAAVAALVILYAVTATRAMADPQPGSSMSSQAGASFTL